LIASDVADGVQTVQEVAEAASELKDAKDDLDKCKESEGKSGDGIDGVQGIADPPGTRRNSNGQLIDSKTGKYVKDPNTVDFKRSKSERKKALLKDAKDPNSGLSDRARKQILDSNGNKVPTGYEVDHKKPLYTEKSVKGKESLDKIDNMQTIRKSEHKKLHTPCNRTKFHKYPRK